MDNKTAFAIVEALGEGIVKKQDGIDNCLTHIEQLDTVNQRLIAENKKMREEIMTLKSEDTAPVKVADYGRFGVAESADNERAYENSGTCAEPCCDPDCCEDDGRYNSGAVDG